MASVSRVKKAPVPPVLAVAFVYYEAPDEKTRNTGKSHKHYKNSLVVRVDERGIRETVPVWIPSADAPEQLICRVCHRLQGAYGRPNKREASDIQLAIEGFGV